MPVAKKTASLTGWVRPREAFTGDLNGEVVVLGPNDVLNDRDQAVKKWPHLFVPLEPDRTRPDVEQMTAAPGEVRG